MNDAAARAKLRDLRVMLRDRRGDVKEAVRVLTGASIAELARRLGDGNKRTDLGMCLAFTQRRRYPHLRRALESEMGLPAYSLDDIIEKEAPKWRDSRTG
jgi:hypothetical protein